MELERCLNLELNLPDHSEQLKMAGDIINKLKFKFKQMQTGKNINGEKHTVLYEETMRILDYIGRLSQPAFDIEEELEQQYTSNYRHAPELGKKLFNDHYEKLHYKYTLLKNRCFKLLEDLDEEYFKQCNCQPPNWNI